MLKQDVVQTAALPVLIIALLAVNDGRPYVAAEKAAIRTE
jgi:hypothetical protein